jgi:hypothetical protein
MTTATATTWTAAERAELLQRHQPYLLYDALEVYFADAADEWTRSQANRLCRSDGTIVTVADGLSLDYLGPTYPDGVKAQRSDYIEASRRNYDDQYIELRRSDQSLRNVIYGRAVEGTSGLWLQYWFWYFLNDYQLAFGIDVHEGDWEMIQLRIPFGEQAPADAVYAQHTYCEIKPWNEVGRFGQELQRDGQPAEAGSKHRPLVYVARGSHASFFDRGYHETDFYDLCDGKQPAKTATRLVDVSDAPPWLQWPGHWGSTKRRYPGPDAPCEHAQWTRPEALLDTARTVHHKEAPDAPHIGLRQHDERLLIEFDTSRCQDAPAWIVVTVNCSDDKADPPRAVRIDVKDMLRGSLDTRFAIDRHKHYDVRAASVDHAGRPSPAEIFLFEPPNPLRAALRRAGSAAGRLVFAFRRTFGIEYGRRSDAPLA